jgi:hypothetical protein
MSFDITPGILIVLISWIASLVMSVIAYKNRHWTNEKVCYLEYPMIITLAYGLFRLILTFLRFEC